MDRFGLRGAIQWEVADILRLFNANEVDFEHNETVLDKVQSCVITEDENGLFSLEMSGPLDERIEEQKIIKAPTPRGEQLFRIAKVRKSVPNKTIYAYARHISYDLLNNFILNVRPTNTSQHNAMNIILNGTEEPHGFTASSDVAGLKTANYVRVNPIQAIMGSQANSALGHWGGFLRRDNFHFEVLATSPDKGYDIRFGKNLIGLDEEVDISGVVTRLYPTVVIEGNIVTALPEKYVDSQYINMYPEPIIKELRIELTEDETALPIESIYQLMRDRATEQFEFKADLPKTNYKVDFVQLRKTEAFKDFAVLEELDISDTVSIFVPIINTNLSARMIKYTYDGLMDRFLSMELGNFKPKLTNQRAEFNRIITEATKDLTDGVITGMLKDAVETIQGNRGGHVVTITNDGRPVAMAFMDTDDINTANNYIIINDKGIAFGQNGLNNPPEVAIDIEGNVVAESGFFRSLTTNLIQSELGQSLDLSSNASIRLSVGTRNYVVNSERELSYSVARRELVIDHHFKVGDVLTVSFQGKADNGSHIVDAYFDDTVNGGINNRSPKFTLTPEFQRFSYSTTLTDTSQYPNGMNLVIRGSTNVDASNAGKTFTIKETKVERGRHTTDWTPAPEDVQAQISVVDDRITSSVNDLEGMISTVTQTAEDLTFAFENNFIGGENLLKGSEFLNVGDINAVPGTSGEYNSLNIGETFQNENLPDGTKITISFDVETLTGIDNLQVYNNNNPGPQGFTTRTIQDIPVGISRQRIKTTLFNRDPVDVQRVGNFIEFYSTYGTDQFYNIRRIKIELGHTETDYSLHPEEFYVGYTRVNKDGIEVGRSDETILSTLEHDGLRVLDKGKLIASFNDSGANVPELIARSIRGNVINTLDGSQTITVGAGKDYATVTEAFDSFGNAKNLSDTTTLTIEIYGEIYDTIRVMGWTGGGQIIIHFMPGARLNGVFRSYGNDCRVTCRGDSATNYGTIKRSGSLSHPVYSLGDKYLRFYYMNLDGAGATASGFYINEGSFGFIYECDIVNVDHAIRAVNGGSVVAYNNRGICSRYGVRAEKGARMYVKGTVPDGADGTTSIWDGFRTLEGTITALTSEYQAPLTQPVEFSQIFRPSRIYTMGHNEVWEVSYYGNTGAQGRWHTHANQMDGCFNFSGAIASFLAGGTGQSVQMRFRRLNSTHGWSAGIAPKPYNFTPSGTFNAVPRGGWTNWVTVPVGVFPSAGTTLKLWDGRVDDGYAIFDACEVRAVVTREV